MNRPTSPWLNTAIASRSSPLWVSDVLPGNVHDLAAARQNVLSVLRPYLKDLPVLADPGYDGAGHGIHVPAKSQPVPGNWTSAPGPATR